MRVSWIVWPWGRFVREFSEENLSWPFTLLNEGHTLTSEICLKTAKLWTAILEKPFNAFEYRLNHDKVESRLSCLTFKSRFYDKVCQSNEAAKVRLIWDLDPIYSLWDKKFMNKVKYFKKYKLFQKYKYTEWKFKDSWTF